MSKDDDGVEMVAVALTIQATEDSYGVGLRVHECFGLVEYDVKLEVVTHWMMLLSELRKDLITEKNDHTVIH
jgi:uncharacterized protein YjbK